MKAMHLEIRKAQTAIYGAKKLADKVDEARKSSESVIVGSTKRSSIVSSSM